MYTHVRWSASTVRSSSAHVVWTIAWSGVPRRWRMTTSSSPVALVDGQLDVAEHPVGVGVGDEQRAGERRRRRWRTRDRRSAARRPPPDRCRAPPRRRRGTTAPAAPRRRRARRPAGRAPCARGRAANRARRTGSAVLGGGGDEPIGDLGVDVGERVGALVEVVERRRRADERRDDGWRAVRRKRCGGRAIAASVWRVTCPDRPGPSPTTVTCRRPRQLAMVVVEASGAGSTPNRRIDARSRSQWP